MEEVGEFLKIVYQLRIAPEGKVVKKVKRRKKDTEDRARVNLLAF